MSCPLTSWVVSCLWLRGHSLISGWHSTSVIGILNECSVRKNCSAYMKFNMGKYHCLLFVSESQEELATECLILVLTWWFLIFMVIILFLKYIHDWVFEAWRDNSTLFWYLLTGTRFVVFHLLILPHHQANTWLNRLVLHSAPKTSLLGFLLSWEGKWIFYASVENVLPVGS